MDSHKQSTLSDNHATAQTQALPTGRISLAAGMWIVPGRGFGELFVGRWSACSYEFNSQVVPRHSVRDAFNDMHPCCVDDFGNVCSAATPFRAWPRLVAETL